MALVKCPDCGKQVSDKAQTCPDCGYPIQEVANLVTIQKELSKLSNTQGPLCERFTDEVINGSPGTVERSLKDIEFISEGHYGTTFFLMRFKTCR